MLGPRCAQRSPDELQMSPEGLGGAALYQISPGRGFASGKLPPDRPPGRRYVTVEDGQTFTWPPGPPKPARPRQLFSDAPAGNSRQAAGALPRMRGRLPGILGRLPGDCGIFWVGCPENQTACPGLMKSW